MTDRRVARAYVLGSAVTFAAMLLLTQCVDWRRGEIVKAFEAPIRMGSEELAWLGPTFPGGGVLDVTPAIAPLFPIGSDLYLTENRLHQEGFHIRVAMDGAMEGKAITASRKCGPGLFDFQATCTVALEYDRGKITKVRAVADEPQGS